MTNTALNTNLRNATLRDIIEFVSQKYNMDALAISSSAIVFPTADEEGNEKYVKISVSVPRGTRDGKGGYEAFDGEVAADDYKAELEERKRRRPRRLRPTRRSAKQKRLLRNSMKKVLMA